MAEDKKQITRIASAILAKKYELSVVFASPKLSQQINKKYRGKNKPANVLSFPLSKTSGEIFLNKESIAKDAKKFELSVKDCVTYMLIHALLHLKGLEHSARMDEQERKFLKKFKIPLPVHLKINGKKKHSSRN
ncbi:MAG: rRNA maturation RNase YbeY [Minisyncoccia bacterium]